MTNDLAPVRTALREFADAGRDRLPLYSAVVDAVADHDDLLSLYAVVPDAEDRIPVLVLAAMHHELLTGEPHPLGDWFPTVVDDPRTDDPTRAVLDLCRTRAERLRHTMQQRTVQTNEVGRCAILLPVLGMVAAEAGPLSLVEVGTSAGLLLHVDRYGYRYGDRVVAPGAPLVLECTPEGHVPVPDALPRIAARVGLDHAPIDVRDPADTAWLRACVWAEETTRFHRLELALEIARTHPSDVVRGDAVDDLPPLVTSAAADGHPVVFDVWVLNYLADHRRQAFVSALDAIGEERDLTWVFVEAPSWTPQLPHPDPTIPETTLTLATWRAGRRTVRRLATAQPHGSWLRWQDATP